MRVRRPNIRLRGTRFWFRRRVPGPLTDRIGRGEIVRSLRTSCPREAARRARAMWLASDRVFSLVAAKKSLGRAQVELILTRLLEESVWDSSSVDELVEGFSDGDLAAVGRLFGPEETEAVLSLQGSEREDVLHHLQRLLDRIAVDVSAKAVDAARLETRLEQLRRLTAEANEARETGRTLARVGAVLRRSPVRLEAHQAPEKSKAAPPEETAPAPSTERRQSGGPTAKVKPTTALSKDIGIEGRSDSAPKFSAPWDAFITEKRQSHEGHRGYSENTVAQSNMTCALFLDFVGDKPLNQYTGSDAQLFRDLLLRLPQSHGKQKREPGAERIDGREQIRGADARQAEVDALNAASRDGEEKVPDIPRIKLKTVKRHFSTMTQYFEFLKPLGHVEKNVFAGFKYPGTRSSKKKRDEWSVEALNLLLGSDWFSPTKGREDFMWMTAIGMFSGMRAEEIARLRCVDVKVAGDTPFFNIVEQPDGWTPKTEAGIRDVPIHPFLLENGLLQYVGARRAEGSLRLFPALRPQGKDKKLSASFSRSFSRTKIKLGIGPKIVFHSFRHSVRTILTNKPPGLVRDAWIDAVMGHSAEDGSRRDGGRPSTGETVYTKQIHVSNLLAAISAIEYPAGVELASLRTGLNKTLPR